MEHLNPTQTHALTTDQPTFAIAKEIQWLRPGSFGEDTCVIMNGSRWPGATTAAGTASPRVAESFVKAPILR